MHVNNEGDQTIGLAVITPINLENDFDKFD